MAAGKSTYQVSIKFHTDRKTGFFFYQNGTMSYHIKTTIPSASVRAFTVFAGPIPPELIAETLTTYLV